MTELQINTTQNVNINFTAASVGERILAYVIDWIIKIAYIIVTYQITFNLLEIDKINGGYGSMVADRHLCDFLSSRHFLYTYF